MRKKYKRTKKNRINFRFALIVLLTIIIFFCLKYARGFYSERVSLYVKNRAISNASIAINNILTKEVLDIVDIGEVINDRNTINTKMFGEVLHKANSIMEDNINDFAIENVFIPYSLILSELFFTDSKLGINVKIRPVSSFETDIVSNLEEYGINNSVLTINLYVKMNVDILIPFNKKTVVVENYIPIAMLVLSGDIPDGIIYRS